MNLAMTISQVIQGHCLRERKRFPWDHYWEIVGLQLIRKYILFLQIQENRGILHWQLRQACSLPFSARRSKIITMARRCWLRICAEGVHETKVSTKILSISVLINRGCWHHVCRIGSRKSQISWKVWEVKILRVLFFTWACDFTIFGEESSSPFLGGSANPNLSRGLSLMVHIDFFITLLLSAIGIWKCNVDS